MASLISLEIWFSVFEFVEVPFLISFASTSTNHLTWVVEYLKLDKKVQTTFNRGNLYYLFNPGSLSFSVFRLKKYDDSNFNTHKVYTLISKFSGNVETKFDHKLKDYIPKFVKSSYQFPYQKYSDSEKWITINNDWFSQRKTRIADKLVFETQEITYATHCDTREDEPIDCTTENPCETCETIYSSVQNGIANKCLPEQCKSCDYFQECDCDLNEKNTAVLTNINRKTLVNGSYLGEQIIDGCRFTIVNNCLIWAKFPNGKSFRVNKKTMSKFNRELERANPFFNSRFKFVDNFFLKDPMGHFYFH
jgi:hypothetical protein